MTTGWECPVCKSVWAPSVLRCQNNHGGQSAPVPNHPIWPVYPGTTTVTSAAPDSATVTYVTTAVQRGPVQIYGAAELPAGYTVHQSFVSFDTRGVA